MAQNLFWNGINFILYFENISEIFHEATNTLSALQFERKNILMDAAHSLKLIIITNIMPQTIMTENEINY